LVLHFSDFYKIFNDFSKLLCNPKNTFAEKSSKEVLEFTHIPFLYVKHPRKFAIKAMQPLPAQGSLPAVESGRGLSG
jgi:hypothetical protein